MIPITLEDALEKSNSLGCYQITLFVVTSLFTAQETFHLCLDIFTSKPLPWRWEDEDASIERASYPPCGSTGRDWMYTTNSTASIRSDFDLFCNPVKLCIIPGALFFGRFLGFLVFWEVSAKFGRRWPLIIAVWCNTIVSWLTTCSSSYEMYVVLRILDGFTMEGFVAVGYVILMECLLKEQRLNFAVHFRSVQGLGFIVLAATAYLCSNWKVMCLMMGVLITVHAALASMFLPESPIWLINKERNEDVVSYINKVSKWNNSKIKEPFYIVDFKKRQPSERIRPETELVITTVCLASVWGLIHTAEYILYLNILYLPGNAYLNLIMIGICDMPGRVLPVVLMERWGGKRTLVLWNLVAGGLLLGCCADIKLSRTLCYFMAKLTLSGSIVLIKLYTHHVTPRSDSSEVYKWCSLVSRLAGVAASFSLLLNSVNLWNLYVVAGCCVFLSTLFILPLPETRGKDKPESVEEFLMLFYGSGCRPVTTGQKSTSAGTYSQTTNPQNNIGNDKCVKYKLDVSANNKHSAQKTSDRHELQELIGSNSFLYAAREITYENENIAVKITKEQKRKSAISRNPSYENSINETGRSVPLDEIMPKEVQLSESALTFTPKSASTSREEFISLSRV